MPSQPVRFDEALDCVQNRVMPMFCILPTTYSVRMHCILPTILTIKYAFNSRLLAPKYTQAIQLLCNAMCKMLSLFPMSSNPDILGLPVLRILTLCVGICQYQHQSNTNPKRQYLMTYEGDSTINYEMATLSP